MPMALDAGPSTACSSDEIINMPDQFSIRTGT